MSNNQEGEANEYKDCLAVFSYYRPGKVDDLETRYVKAVDKEKVEENEKMLRESFAAKFHGHVPRIVHEIAIAKELYADKYSISDFVDRFNIQKIKKMMELPELKGHEVAVAMLYVNELYNNVSDLEKLGEFARYICAVYASMPYDHAYEDENLTDVDRLDTMLKWISKHADSDINLFAKMLYSHDFRVYEDDTVRAVKAKWEYLQMGREEYDKIYDVYGNMWGLECSKCTIAGVGKKVFHDNYIAYIMEPDDIRQIILGHITYCCQRMDQEGESAMMFGLVADNAGFLIIEDARDGHIVAQAEVWEKDEYTLVFDNIEFANDAKIESYRAVLGKWLEECEYPNVYCGLEYQAPIQRYSHYFKFNDGVMLDASPQTIYILSHEQDSEDKSSMIRKKYRNLESPEEAQELMESGKVSIMDYIYSDADNECVVFKEDGQLPAFFKTTIGVDFATRFFDKAKYAPKLERAAEIGDFRPIPPELKPFYQSYYQRHQLSIPELEYMTEQMNIMDRFDQYENEQYEDDYDDYNDEELEMSI